MLFSLATWIGGKRPMKYRVTLAIMVKWSMEEAYGLSTGIV